jgi:preprotein translocase subunit SecB
VNETLVEYNGPAVLYGSIRELVMQVTSRGPFPPIVLPTVSFVNPETKVEPDGRLSKE